MHSSVKQTLFVNAVVYNKEQQILLVRRSPQDYFLPGYLELPGGRVEPGESLEHALKRKLQQDLHITCELPLYFRSYAGTNQHGPFVRALFEVNHDPHSEISLTSNHTEYIWADRNVLSNDKIADYAQSVLSDYLGSIEAENGSATPGSLLTIYTDGGSRGNPGPSASGFVIYDDSHKVIEDGGAYIGITTNNQAEYMAVELALEAALKHGAPLETELHFNLDSLLVVNQMNGVYKIKNRDLWPIHQKIRELIKAFKAVRFVHVPRAHNAAADTKVNQLLDAHDK